MIFPFNPSTEILAIYPLVRASHPKQNFGYLTPVIQLLQHELIDRLLSLVTMFVLVCMMCFSSRDILRHIIRHVAQLFPFLSTFEKFLLSLFYLVA
jgi:hypothetical protein